MLTGTNSKILLPGELFTGNDRWTITTVLGSCVSITLWHPTLKIGSMSHFMLPTRPGTSENRLCGKYGDDALTLMMLELSGHRVPVHECEAKLFGGGAMTPRSQEGANIGYRNGVAARELLESNNIKIVNTNLYGVGHRKIVFDIKTGSVFINHVQTTMYDT